MYIFSGLDGAQCELIIVRTFAVDDLSDAKYARLPTAGKEVYTLYINEHRAATAINLIIYKTRPFGH